jgi:copper transport protein
MPAAPAPRPAAVVARLLAALVAVAAVVLAFASPASAHAVELGTEPPSGASLDAPPAQVSVTFDSHVDVSIGGIKVLDANGKTLVSGTTKSVGDDIVADTPGLGDGAYLVSWSVISPDGHPVRGAFTFTVGSGGALKPGLLQDVLSSSGASRAVGVAAASVRALLFAALAVALGTVAAFAVAPVWLTAPRARWRRLVEVACLAGIAACALSIALQGANAAGGGLGDALRWSLWRHVLVERFGRAAAVRAIVLLALVPLAGAATLDPASTRRWRWRASALVAGAVIVGSVAASGHAGTGRDPLLGFVADVAHVGAMCCWLGGLVALAVAFGLLTRDERPVLARRISTLAAASVAVLLLSGAAQGWRQVGTLDGLTSTTYGRLLLAKVGIVAAMLVLAGLNRWLVRRRGSPPALVRSVAAELVGGVGAVVVTALLVVTVPAIDLRAQPFVGTVLSGSTIVELTVDPITAGQPAVAHLYLSPTGGSLQLVQDVEVHATLPDKDLGPLDLGMEQAGPNHYADERLTLPLPGTWQIAVTGRLGQFDAVSATFEVRVR